MLGIFKKPAPSKNVARDRLKMILVTDRADTSNHMMEMMKNDLLKVLQQYMHIDESDFDVQICQQGHESGDNTAPPRLKADIPIKSMRRR